MYRKGYYLACYLGIVLEALSNAFMFITTLMDPGIIPQQVRRYEIEEELFPLPIA